MQKLIVFILVLSITGSVSYAQSSGIHGKISDTTEKKALINGSVLLLRRSDSILVSHTRTDKNGNFSLKHIPTGQFLLLVTFPKYADYVDELTIKDSTPMELAPIAMVLKSQLLQEVVVNGNKGAIHMKGDTLEFKADSFYTQAGANVEELLKKLPGIQVDKNGKITAQGETVQKVLVDGEEFFGDDPTLVTQNLRANIVDKVQVYDKKSDQAAFTGIDDGERTKTINIKLKDGKKNGYFGKLSAGGATDGYYDMQAMLNYFRNKKKFALYGILSNTGKTGLNWQERDKYGQSDLANAEYDEAMGYYSIQGQSDDLQNWNGQYNGQGLPTVKTGGIHYNDKWDNDHQSGNLNYKFMQLDVKDSSSSLSQYLLHDTLYNNSSTGHSDNQILRHRVNGLYELTLDSTSSIKITADGGSDHKISHNESNSELRNADSVLINSGQRTTSTTGDNQTLNSNILWRKKLAKKGRTISVNFKENYTNATTDGYYFSDNSFFSKGALDHKQVVDQYKKYNSRNILLNSRVTYTEPLSAVSFLTANYGIALDNSSSDRTSYNRSPDGKYGLLDTLYSNDYQFNMLTHQGGLFYSLIKKKWRVNAGSNLGATQFHQTDLHSDSTLKRDFINWFPSATITYSFTNQKRLSFRYNGNTSQPRIQQIQPIRVNDDPLNIYVGNPGLHPSFNNSINLNYFDYKILTERYISGNLSYSATQNSISSNSSVDTSGRRVTQYINLNGNYNLYGSLYYSFKLKKPKMSIGFNSNFSQSRYNSIVNSFLNSTTSGNYTLGMNIYKSLEKKFDFSLNASGTYTESRSSINKNVVTSYKTWSIQPNLDIYLPYKFQLHGDCDISLREKISAFDKNTNVYLVNAWLGKKLLKNDALLIKASGNDLLNQNIGFNRSVSSNFLSQNTWLSIKRYFMFSVTWNFTKAGTPAPVNN